MSAIIHPFPLSRNANFVGHLAREMALLSDKEAEQFLLEHFQMEWDRLVYFGVAEPEIERQIHTTAQAVWALMFKILAGAA